MNSSYGSSRGKILDNVEFKDKDDNLMTVLNQRRAQILDATNERDSALGYIWVQFTWCETGVEKKE